jgi:hypothetical protein
LGILLHDLLVCSKCGAIVPNEVKGDHEEWHRNVNTLLYDLANKVFVEPSDCIQWDAESDSITFY